MKRSEALDVLRKQQACRDAFQADERCDMNCSMCEHDVSADLMDAAIAVAISVLEKQIPKKPKRIDKNATFDGNWKKVCPACGRTLMERITTPEESYPEIYNHTPHCICGQAIDWEEE